MRSRYKTKLSKKINAYLKEQAYSLERISWIAKELNSNVSSVWYQVYKLVSENILVKVGRFFVLKSQLALRTVAASVLKVLNFEKRIREASFLMRSRECEVAIPRK